MKEINTIFRGKIVGSNTGFHHHDWMYGNLVEELSTGKVFICDLSHFDSNTKLVDVMVEVEPETVGQYTSKNDEMGKKIYEGDIVEIKNNDLRWRGVIRKTYSNNMYLFLMGINFLIDENEEQVIYDHLVDYYERKDVSFVYNVIILGNIHDNPELLCAMIRGEEK